MVDFSPSIGNRETVRIPDWPAVNLSQFSFLPAPREVTTPMPVTTTIGRPNLSRGADMCPSSMSGARSARARSRLLPDCFDQCEAFALPVAGTFDDNLFWSTGLFDLEAGGIIGRE